LAEAAKWIAPKCVSGMTTLTRSPRRRHRHDPRSTILVGLHVAWKWEGVGGLLILGGFAFFAIVKTKCPVRRILGDAGWETKLA
jgi:hypothetical protein